MKRLLSGFGLAVGMLPMGAVNASAATICTIDPTIGVGTPLQYSSNVWILGTHVYASGANKTTTFGGALGV